MKAKQLAGAEGRLESAAMCQTVLDMLKLTRAGFIGLDEGSLDAAGRLGTEVHREEKALTRRLVPTGGQAPNPEAEDFFVPMHLERVGDNLDMLVGAIRRKMIHEGVLFTPRARQELVSLLDLAAEVVECTRDALRTDNRTLVRHVLGQCRHYEQQANEFAVYHERRLIEGVCQPKASSVYLAMLDYLKGVEWHMREVAQKISVRLLPDQVTGTGQGDVPGV